ncbi:MULTISPECIES: Cof-type HAD-IIB family hydrolase [unclassified Paenibacillus]|jgi:Cof subfamily protein (haloacid dehalogenase superfamily)|uniref:Cof-type HAD-IIB family hydrolase n=1 Tax=unclassified Paenibacillus TaxID=185978 RepID=UPI000575E0CC|nr:Cof-type HAD-IIB family hydrolase [Paenibacillus sp. IHB B 3415]KHL94887.1 hydrolase [Paenibacillus sp. IHB B 3415]
MLIALDMDGTLLNGDGEISRENKEAILHAQRLGHTVIIATGRSYMDAERQLRLADLECPVVSLNGAVVTLPDGTLAASTPLNKEDIIPALRWMNEIPELYYEVYTEDNVYVELDKRVRLEKLSALKEDEVPEEVGWLLKAMIDQQFQQAAVTYVESMEDIWSKEENLIYKTLAFSLNRELLKEASTRFAAIPGLIITASHVNNIEINHKDANKGNGVKLMAEHYGIPAAQIAVMGDSYNDLPMFEIAGYRIAMENAAPILKETADFITLSNSEHGVAAGLRHLLDKQ